MEKRTVLITGASEGIGFEIAKQFAINKYQLILVARNEEKLARAYNQLSPYTKVLTIPTDLTELGAPKNLYDLLCSQNMKVEADGDYKISFYPTTDAAGVLPSQPAKIKLEKLATEQPAVEKTFSIVAGDLDAGALGLPTGTAACLETAPNGTAWTYNSVGLHSLLAISNATNNISCV